MAQFMIAMLVCADLERSRDFYRDVLGLKLKTDAVPDWVDFDLGGGALLGLHPKTELHAVRPGSLQIGFSVENVDRFVEECSAKGAPIFQSPCDESFGRFAMIGDPDGYAIQIISSPR
jgi:predicted enzyme related to lactoylglutathione lyase